MTEHGPATPRKSSVFVGSSSERVELCRFVQLELEAAAPCEVTLWTQGVFGPSSYSLDDLIVRARASDFAILVASPDDEVTRRGEAVPTARDNVIFELGLFFGVLGRERTFVLNDQSEGRLTLPSDLAGLTYLRLGERQDKNMHAAVGAAVFPAAQRIKAKGPLDRTPGPVSDSISSAGDQDFLLAREIQRVCGDAEAQGWRVKTNSDDTSSREPARTPAHAVAVHRTRDARRTSFLCLRSAGRRATSESQRPSRGLVVCDAELDPRRFHVGTAVERSNPATTGSPRKGERRASTPVRRTSPAAGIAPTPLCLDRLGPSAHPLRVYETRGSLAQDEITARRARSRH